jgi:hypothetical protein
MGELAEDFRFMDEQRKKEKATKTPDRMAYAMKLLKENGHTVISTEVGQLTVDGYIILWVYTGWWSGKGIGSGRGIHDLVKKLKEKRL